MLCRVVGTCMKFSLNDTYKNLKTIEGGKKCKNIKKKRERFKEVLKGGTNLMNSTSGQNIDAKEFLLKEIKNEELKQLTIFSSNLKSARKEKEITQKELSEKSGIPQKTISRIESGKDYPNIRTIMKIAKSLDKKIELRLSDI